MIIAYFLTNRVPRWTPIKLYNFIIIIIENRLVKVKD